MHVVIGVWCVGFLQVAVLIIAICSPRDSRKY